MGFQAEVLRVLIASPSDVKQERDEIESVIFEWNKRFAEETHVILLPSRWEDDVTPSYGGSDPQQIINNQLINKCDILIGVFWTKLGTATSKHLSGTLEEINIFIEMGKEVMLYFVDKDIPRQTDFSEVKKVDEFRNQYGQKGIYSPYNASKIMDHLYKKIMNLRKKSPQSQIVLNPIVNNSVSKTEQPDTLGKLIEADKLTRNELLLLKYVLDTGNRQLGFRWMAAQTEDSIKKWENEYRLIDYLSTNYNGTVSNLVERGFLEAKEYTSYGNAKLYVMPLPIFDELQSLNDEIRSLIDKAVYGATFPF